MSHRAGILGAALVLAARARPRPLRVEAAARAGAAAGAPRRAAHLRAGARLSAPPGVHRQPAAGGALEHSASLVDGRGRRRNGDGRQGRFGESSPRASTTRCSRSSTSSTSCSLGPSPTGSGPDRPLRRRSGRGLGRSPRRTTSTSRSRPPFCSRTSAARRAASRHCGLLGERIDLEPERDRLRDRLRRGGGRRSLPARRRRARRRRSRRPAGS